ncbi:aminoglycoside phosphotransferase family protein [Actinokineospora bangkokensis]|uniref:Aminoglycoside phosphotransferase n=1 Tax=Actinokineospora bangkokensis TaxID=1193682 RepID=A0A1Q9LT14_9PSEU|nr:aminoglycoside phosphotransferase family protein [Actinokineospora bangkokensis]OLR95168.1 hypothetical protein BJP25_07665 [Actinokineospora bangkokensis]
MDVATRMRNRFGDGVLAWTEALPARLARLAARWDLEVGEAFADGNSAVTLRVLRGGEPAVLKVSPDVDFAAEQAEVLTAWSPTGRVPRLLAADRAEGALLMEHVDGTEGTWPEPAGFAALLRDLHGAVDDPAAVARRHLRSKDYEDFPRFTPTGPVTAAHLARARERRVALLAREAPLVLLHGDLHAANLVDGGPDRGVVAIDPKAVLGEPEFDAVDYVLDAPGGRVEQRRDALLAASDLDPERLDGWCRATAAVIAVSRLRRGLPIDGLLAYGDG